VLATVAAAITPIFHKALVSPCAEFFRLGEELLSRLATGKLPRTAQGLHSRYQSSVQIYVLVRNLSSLVPNYHSLYTLRVMVYLK
jgi:hypothetical protein